MGRRVTRRPMELLLSHEGWSVLSDLFRAFDEAIAPGDGEPVSLNFPDFGLDVVRRVEVLG